MFRASLNELKSTRTVASCAMLMALAIVLGMFKIVTPVFTITFGFIAFAMMGRLYGPAVTALCAGCCDIITFVLKPSGTFFFMFTLSAMAGGLVYGMFLYRANITPARIFLCKLCINVFVNIGLNTLAMWMLTSSMTWPMFLLRVQKNILLLPVEAAILYGAIKLLEKTYKMQKKSN